MKQGTKQQRGIRGAIRRLTVFAGATCGLLIGASAQQGQTARADDFETAARNNAARLHAEHLEVRMDGGSICNSVAFSQVPDKKDLFIGRILNNTTSDPCSGTTWSLALFQMDWARHELRFKHYVLRPPFEAAPDGRQIQSAYDPSVAVYDGTRWVAFECAAPKSVSTCAAPLDADMKADPKRVSVLVFGVSKGGEEKWSLAAGNPKLFTFKGRPYLYWTVVRFDEHGFVEGDSRGAELKEVDGRLRVTGSGGKAVRTDDKTLTTEVWGSEPGDPRSDKFADIFGVLVEGGTIVATAGLGGGGTEPGENCVSPTGNSFGCYRMEIARASAPLGDRIFNKGRFELKDLPSNPEEYSRIIEGPDGSKYVVGMYLPPPAKYVGKYASSGVPRGLLIYPIQLK